MSKKKKITSVSSENESLDDKSDTIESSTEIFSEENFIDCKIEDIVKEVSLDSNNLQSEQIVLSGNDRITNPRLTRYEMVRILGERTKQLIMGAKPLVKNHQDFNYEDIAIEELKLNMIPFKIKRPLPDNKIEIWNVAELNKNHLVELKN